VPYLAIEFGDPAYNASYVSVIVHPFGIANVELVGDAAAAPRASAAAAAAALRAGAPPAAGAAPLAAPPAVARADLARLRALTAEAPSPAPLTALHVSFATSDVARDQAFFEDGATACLQSSCPMSSRPLATPLTKRCSHKV